MDKHEKKKLFRNESLESVSSPAKLDEYIKITHPGIWVTVLGCIALLVAVIVWLATGMIPETITVKGVVFPKSGTTSIVAPAGGMINDLRIEVGDSIFPHQIVAVIPQTNIVAQIEEETAKENPDEDTITALQHNYETYSVLRSEIYGTVLSVLPLNSIVGESEPIAVIARSTSGSSEYSVTCYVDADTARRLRTGMEVQVSPSFAPREEYGYMYGRITSIGAYPITYSEAVEATGNVGM
ncbi:hypothetical protein LJC56_09155, partial [Christensenellaceae bacterium OttesenSCG-928-K19]|nr:hypothetical protein [Christensenellaceae bacterium OttesenSCG-928-K19]